MANSTNGKPPISSQELAIKAHESEERFWYQANQAAIDSGAAAIKTFFLLNGGAAIALLAFIGALTAPGRLTDGDFLKVANALVWFTVGVGASAGSAGAAYLTNYFTAAASSSRTRKWDWPYLEKPKSRWVFLRGLCLTVAVAFGFGALGAFGVGMWEVKGAVQTIKFAAPPPK